MGRFSLENLAIYDTVHIQCCNVSLTSSSSRPCSRTPVQALAFAHMTTQRILYEYSLFHSSIYVTLFSSICWLMLVFFCYITNYRQVTTKHTYVADIKLCTYNIQKLTLFQETFMNPIDLYCSYILSREH